MQAVKQKKTFKETVKDTGFKIKAYAKKQNEKVKSYGKKYGADIRTAYDKGYARGWDDAYDIPKRIGAKRLRRMVTKRDWRNVAKQTNTQNNITVEVKNNEKEDFSGDFKFRNVSYMRFCRERV